jgi:membrane dipeptidase
MHGENQAAHAASAATASEGRARGLGPAPAASPDAAATSLPPGPSGTKSVAHDVETRARELAQRLIILDGHIDAPYRLEHSRDAKGQLTDDISGRSKRGDFDYERARSGGLDVPFMSIYVPTRYEKHGARHFADKLIDLVTGVAEQHPEKFAIITSPSDARANAARGRISLALGMENGAPLEHKLTNVAYFHKRGIRYITLTHYKDNHIADSATDARRTHRGLSNFGKRVVKEMNRLGIMIDVSHVSDETFWQVLEHSRVPVIASHSSCRHFTPGFPRNMNDDMIRALGKAGGVIQINFGSGFLDDGVRKLQNERLKQLMAELKEQGLDAADPRSDPFKERFFAQHPLPRATIAQVADHIQHVVTLAGIEHVGLGSDFDGVGDTLPAGLKDVSQYPNLIRVLLERGYTDGQIEAVCSGNVLRVWQAAEDFARDAAVAR